jgi:hypothetical protein
VIEQVSFPSLNPEGLAFHRADGTGEYFVLSDDGNSRDRRLRLQETEGSGPETVPRPSVRF